jgi:hypothetical protein
LFCIKRQFNDVRLHRALNTVALDFSCFVKMSVQFGGAIRGANLKRVAVCLLAATLATV